MSVDKFEIHQNQASDLFGQNPKLELLLENEQYPFAHEAGAFIQENNTLFTTSNQLSDASGHKTIQISRVTVPADGSPVVCEEIQPRGVGVPMANGGVNYKDGVLFCAQGNMNELGGLVYMKTNPPYETETIISSFHGRPFNSVNDVVVHSNGSIWFTDPIYGHEQGFKPKPRLPCQVYRYDLEKRSIRAMADGFGRPNGICFSPDEKTVYVTDTDWRHGDGTSDDARVSSIYAFDVSYYSGEPFLINHRLFAMADTGIPDGIKCDVQGNVYSGCGDGINIWSPGGVLLGKILVPEGAANFCFGRNGEMFILNENRLWKATLSTSTRGALLGI